MAPIPLSGDDVHSPKHIPVWPRSSYSLSNPDTTLVHSGAVVWQVRFTAHKSTRIVHLLREAVRDAEPWDHHIHLCRARRVAGAVECLWEPPWAVGEGGSAFCPREPGQLACHEVVAVATPMALSQSGDAGAQAVKTQSLRRRCERSALSAAAAKFNAAQLSFDLSARGIGQPQNSTIHSQGRYLWQKKAFAFSSQFPPSFSLLLALAADSRPRLYSQYERVLNTSMPHRLHALIRQVPIPAFHSLAFMRPFGLPG